MLWVVIFLIIEALIVVYIITSVYSFVRAVIIRSSFLKKLRSIVSEKGYTLKSERKAFASFFKSASAPDLILETKETKYLIRFITCYKRKRFYHFANEQYYAFYSKLFFALPLAKQEESLRGQEKFRYLPPLDQKYIDEKAEEKPQNVFLFSPAPVEITHLGKILSNGDKIENHLIFSGKGFLEYLSR